MIHHVWGHKESNFYSPGYGSTSPSNQSMEDFCGKLFTDHTMKGLDGTAYLKFMTHTAAANLSQYYNVRGRIIPVNSACTTSTDVKSPFARPCASCIRVRV